jgi:hypothetical protein
MKNDKRDGYYWIENDPYVSVTEVLKVIAKPAIQYWYGQQVYREVIKDPTIDERAALAAPYKTSKDAASRGTTIHSIIESFKLTGSVIDTVPEQFKGYAKAFYSWANDIKPEIIYTEKQVSHDFYHYAGTLDMLAKIGGKIYVIDFKTSKDGSIYNEAHLQVSAYRACLNDVDGGIIVGLAENGIYHHTTAFEAFKPFASALTLYAFINQDKLAKYGWKGRL